MTHADSLTLDIRRGHGPAMQTVLHGPDGLKIGPVDLRSLATILEHVAGGQWAAPSSATKGPHGGLHSVDDDAARWGAMDDDTPLRLVLELDQQAAGGTYAHIRRFDQSVEYGPINVQDLPYLIEALISARDPLGSPGIS